MKYKIKSRIDDIGKYYWVTRKWFIFEFQISPSIFYTYNAARKWLITNT